MKIRLSELRRIIREVLEEQGDVPGHLSPGSSGPMSGEKMHSTEHGGMGVRDEEDEEEDDLEEIESFDEDTDL
jgi:hypothetical protein